MRHRTTFGKNMRTRKRWRIQGKFTGELMILNFIISTTDNKLREKTFEETEITVRLAIDRIRHNTHLKTHRREFFLSNECKQEIATKKVKKWNRTLETQTEPYYFCGTQNWTPEGKFLARQRICKKRGEKLFPQNMLDKTNKTNQPKKCVEKSSRKQTESTMKTEKSYLENKYH